MLELVKGKGGIMFRQFLNIPPYAIYRGQVMTEETND